VIRRFILIVFTLIYFPSLGTAALELIVIPQKAPIGGVDLSNGVAVIRETGEIRSLTSEGQCSIEVSPEIEQVTVDVFVPGFQSAGGIFHPTAKVQLPLFLQTFVGDEVVLDLGQSAAMVLSARTVIADAAEKAAKDPRTDHPNAPPDTGPPTGNPFVIIEAIVGKSMAEILGMDKK
jgi:hypothetical protein